MANQSDLSAPDSMESEPLLLPPPPNGPCIDERKYLYDEILHNSTRVSTALGLMVTGTTGTLAIILKNGEDLAAFPCFFAFVFILPCALYIFSQLESTTKNATYLEVFHETEETDARWETNLRFFRYYTENKFGQTNEAGIYSYSIRQLILNIALIVYAVTILILISKIITGSTSEVFWIDLSFSGVFGSLSLIFLSLILQKLKKAENELGNLYRKSWEEINEKIMKLEK